MHKTTTEHTQTNAIEIPDPPLINRTGSSSLAIDYDFYEKMLDDTGWTSTQKRDFIEALWSVMVGFVDLGFEIHPLQQAGGLVDSSAELLPPSSSNVVSSPHGSKTDFEEAAAENALQAGERIRT